MSLRTWRRAVAALCVLLPAAWPQSALAIDANLGYSRLSYSCASPGQIDFTWTEAANASFYSLQLRGPIDPEANGGVNGTYLRQFGLLEIQKGAATSASVSLPSAPAGAVALQWQVMVGGKHGYSGLVPRQQTALVLLPCTAASRQDSPFE